MRKRKRVRLELKKDKKIINENWKMRSRPIALANEDVLLVRDGRGKEREGVVMTMVVMKISAGRRKQKHSYDICSPIARMMNEFICVLYGFV